ncbi:hypothetical protein [Halobaculum sp. EA56]|uniref:hypothetical protein n=1 Tax=Halobaculum sp. EA56 TaxID=3421648 RepID=UPI003EC0353C
MERRKFVVGLGSLAAGGAAAMSTGAVSSFEAERAITGRTVKDSEANLQFRPGNQHGGKAEFANVGDSGGELELALKFPSLNPDAFQAFDDVFKITNTGPEDLEVGIYDAMEDVAFYFGEDLPGSAGGLFSKTAGPVSLPSGGTAYVGVTIDTRDDGNADDDLDYTNDDGMFTGTDGIGGDDDFLVQASEDLNSGPVRLGNGPGGNG